MNTSNIIKNSKIPVMHTVSGLNGKYLTDTDVTVSVEYFVQGKYSQGTYKPESSEIVFDSDTKCNTFTAIVNTYYLPTGRLAALIKVKYHNSNDIMIKEQLVVLSDIIIMEVV